jgi:hypothetical protein
MAMPNALGIRAVLLEAINSNEPRGPHDHRPNLQQVSVLETAAAALAIRQNPEFEQALLTQWQELFRTGLLAWGLNLANPNPPFFHLTERGRRALANASRDPSNPAGYLRHLASVASLEPIAMSYLREGLDCYVDGLFKAAAVMIGCATESLILSLRDATVQKLMTVGKPVPPKLNDWKTKTVSDSLKTFLDTQSKKFSHELRESFEAYWSAFAQQIRAARNDAGHPANVDPVTPDTVHASLLVFSEIARIANGLSTWVTNDLA